MRRLPALLAVASIASISACTGPMEGTEAEEAEVAVTRQAIVGGTTDNSDPSVVLVVVHYSGGFQETCSGTVIAQRVILTAAHCFLDMSAGTVSSVDVGFAQSYVLPASAPAIGLTLADTYFVSPDYNPSNPLAGHDVAVVLLNSPAGAPAIPYHAGAPDSTWIGKATRLIGYGTTSASAHNDGTRRVVSTVLGGFDAAVHFFNGGKQNCHSDSGGPALMVIGGVETLVGIASASTTDCLTRGYYSRVDTDIDFINAHVAMAGASGGGGGGGGSGSGGTQVGGCSMSRGMGPSPRGLGLLVIAAVVLLLRRRYA